MAKAEKRPICAVVRQMAEVISEWQRCPGVEPGSQLHAMYVQLLKRLLAESQKCDR